MAFDLAFAQQAAEDFVAIIKPYCERVAIAGSIRRRRHQVHDIDVVAVPDDPLSLEMRLAPIPRRRKSDGKVMDGPKMKALLYSFVDIAIPVDLYLTTSRNWGCTLLIRTGSRGHNILMVSRAKARDWKLHASGEGLYDARKGGRRIDDGTEEGIFRALDMPYKEPWEREV